MHISRILQQSRGNVQNLYTLRLNWIEFIYIKIELVNESSIRKCLAMSYSEDKIFALSEYRWRQNVANKRLISSDDQLYFIRYWMYFSDKS